MKSKKKRDRQADLEKDRMLAPEKIKKKKRKKRKKILIAVLCEAAILIAVILTAFQIVRAVGKSSLQSKAEAAPELMPVQAQAALTEEEQSKWQEGWVKYQDTIYAYKEDILTFLIMGIDKNSDVKEEAEGTSGGQADALFLAVMDPREKTIKVIGINRNTMTDIDVYNEEGAYLTTVSAQIAVQHGFGNGMEESCERQLKAVRKLFYNLPIHGYAAINMSAIPTINDAVGGVQVTVLEDLTQRDQSLVEGESVHLEGESAFWYVKYRDTNVFGSADKRLERQKQYLNEFIGAAKKAIKKNPAAAVNLYQAVSGQMVTNVSIDEVAYLAPLLAEYKFQSDSFYMPEGETIMGDQFEEFYVDEDALYEMILDVFYEEVKDE